MRVSNSYFEDFLKEIRLRDYQTKQAIQGHTALRNRLMKAEDLKDLMVTTFLQGSYRRSTAVRPVGEKRSDVDVVVVTRIPRSEFPRPDDAMDLFEPFLQRHYDGKYKRNGRSFGISLSYVDLDVVITSAPSEEQEALLKSMAVAISEPITEFSDWVLSENWQPPEGRSEGYDPLVVFSEEAQWKTEPLYIPDRDADEWRQTHPLEQMRWTSATNQRTNGSFVNVVKAIKWWQRLHLPDGRPKGYPLERVVGEFCPDQIDDIQDGIVATFSGMAEAYSEYDTSSPVPVVHDTGIPSLNVMERITREEFASFVDSVNTTASLIEEIDDSDDTEACVEKWQRIFGDEAFPSFRGSSSGRSTASGPFTRKSKHGDNKPRMYG